MNILYITHCDPRQTGYGSAQRSHHLWEALKKIGTVYTVYNVGELKETPVCDSKERICPVHFSPDGYLALRLFAWLGSMFSPFVWPFRSEKSLRRKMPWKDIVFDKVVVRYLGNVSLSNAWLFGDVYVDIDDLPTESFRTIRKKRLIPPLGVIGDIIVYGGNGTSCANARHLGLQVRSKRR